MTAPADLKSRFNLRRFLLSGDGWPYLLVPFIPVAIVLELLHTGATPIFLAAALGVIPTAALMGRSTEELSARSGPGIGGFLNVTFGNFPELVIALFALREGLQEVVKASIVGSILGDLEQLSVGVSVVLLITYAAGLVFSLKTHRDLFNPSHAAEDHGGEPWSIRRAVTMLAVAGVAVGVMSEILVGSITEAS